MSKHDDGGPASEKSLLDEFAGQALAMCEADGPDLSRCRSAEEAEDASNHYAETIANAAYMIADAMIAEKRRREGGAA